MPLSVPPLESVRPAGSVPVLVQMYGERPPDAAITCAYREPRAAFGNNGVAIATGATTVSESWREAVCCGVPVSTTCATNGKVPVAVAVPEITPAALKFTPGGSDPPMSDHTSELDGGLPPSAD